MDSDRWFDPLHSLLVPMPHREMCHALAALDATWDEPWVCARCDAATTTRRALGTRGCATHPGRPVLKWARAPETRYTCCGVAGALAPVYPCHHADHVRGLAAPTYTAVPAALYPRLAVAAALGALTELPRLSADPDVTEQRIGAAAVLVDTLAAAHAPPGGALRLPAPAGAVERAEPADFVDEMYARLSAAALAAEPDRAAVARMAPAVYGEYATGEAADAALLALTADDDRAVSAEAALMYPDAAAQLDDAAARSAASCTAIADGFLPFVVLTRIDGGLTQRAAERIPTRK